MRENTPPPRRQCSSVLTHYITGTYQATIISVIEIPPLSMQPVTLDPLHHSLSVREMPPLLHLSTQPLTHTYIAQPL